MPGKKRSGAQPLLVNLVSVPAVALLVNQIVPYWPTELMSLTKFCVLPELLAIPEPEMVRVRVGFAVIVNALAPALNTMLLTWASAEKVRLVVPEVLKVAVSPAPLGIVFGVQFEAVFQLPVAGADIQAELPAKAVRVSTAINKSREKSELFKVRDESDLTGSRVKVGGCEVCVS